jgi:hypothetical protein
MVQILRWCMIFSENRCPLFRIMHQVNLADDKWNHGDPADGDIRSIYAARAHPYMVARGRQRER